ncbi:MAG TPA: metallophosphatase domain-containing protein [Bacillota bacterium]|nr:metallophosphatase domain-containing protein [Bacillota bacterium]
MKVLCLSDTHGHHRKLRTPEADLFLFAGDMEASSFSRLADFSDWVASIPLPAERKIIISGNHDGVFERHPLEARNYLDGIATYLENSCCMVAGLKVYGTPVSLAFNNWFFNIPDDGSIKDYWDLIPPDTDILLTHQPPSGILDSDSGQKNLGCSQLLSRVKELQLRLHCFGHIHPGYGLQNIDSTTFVNASICNDWNVMVHEPIVLQMEFD